MKLTYRQAYDRIVDAYFKEKLDPYENCACFIGNLLGGNGAWSNCRTSKSYYPDYYGNAIETQAGINLLNEYGYSADQITDLEIMFLCTLVNYDFKKARFEAKKKARHTIYATFHTFDEDKLFKAMSSTLDMLKKIHEENGEIVDAPVFTKRILQTA